MPEVIVEARGVSKKFCRSLKHGMKYTVADVMRDTIGLRGKNAVLRPTEFWAVRDLSFKLERGDCLGLIGGNGAGKSTLLKMLNGIIRPDLGSIRLKGRVGALIEVGAGFHPMLSGKENIYVNGAILGMSAKEIDKRYDEIVEFSGLDPEVLGAPVKTYSSGMYVRLGFAVAVHTDPHILLVDEILAVGDVAFQAQCGRKIRELMDRGVTLIVVSHSSAMIQRLCNKALLLESGCLVEEGNPASVLSAYTRRKVTISQKPQIERRSTSGVHILDIELVDDRNEPCSTIETGDDVTVRVAYEAHKPILDPHFLVSLRSPDGSIYTGAATVYDGISITRIEGKGNFEVRFPRLSLGSGIYDVGCAITDDRLVGHHALEYGTVQLSVDTPRAMVGNLEIAHEWRICTEEVE